MRLTYNDVRDAVAGAMARNGMLAAVAEAAASYWPMKADAALNALVGLLARNGYDGGTAADILNLLSRPGEMEDPIDG